MSDIRKLIPDIPLEPSPAPTLYEQLWFKLDGAYERYRKIRRLVESRGTEAGLDPQLARGRALGLVQAIAIMSSGVLTEDEVQAMCVKRYKERQPKTRTSPLTV